MNEDTLYAAGDPAGIDSDDFTAMVDDQRKALKENAGQTQAGTTDQLGRPLPPQDAAMYYSPLSGEVFDADDLDGIRSAWRELDAYIEGIYAHVRRQHRQLLDARKRLEERMIELDPVTIPKHAWQRSPAHAKVLQCPRCLTKFESSEPADVNSSPEVGSPLPGSDTSAPPPAAQASGAEPEAPRAGAASAPTQRAEPADGNRESGAGSAPLSRPDPED